MASNTSGFSRSLRLLAPEQFSEALKSRPIARGAFFTCHWCESLSTDQVGFALPKLGFIVPKRLVRLAVRRNAIKRVLREAFRARQTTLASGYYVFRLKAPIKIATLTELKRNIRIEADQLLDKART